jgi:hypothetical protein
MAKTKTIKRILNVLPSKGTELDWEMTNAVAAGMLSAPPTLPTSKDLRDTWWKVGDKGLRVLASDGVRPKGCLGGTS